MKFSCLIADGVQLKKADSIAESAFLLCSALLGMTVGAGSRLLIYTAPVDMHI